MRVVRRQLEEEALGRGADEVGGLVRDHVVEEVGRLLAVRAQAAVVVEHVVVAGVGVTARDRDGPLRPSPAARSALSFGFVRVVVEVLAEQRGRRRRRTASQTGRQSVCLATVAEGRPAAAGLAQVGDDPVVVDVLAAQDGGPRRAAQRVGDGVVGEGHALVLQRGQPRHLLEQVPVEVVGEDEDDVRDVVQRAAGRGRVGRGRRRLGWLAEVPDGVPGSAGAGRWGSRSAAPGAVSGVRGGGLRRGCVVSREKAEPGDRGDRSQGRRGR